MRSRSVREKTYDAAVIDADTPTFCAGVLICVYPNCNAIVIAAPIAKVPLLPRYLVSTRTAATHGPIRPATWLIA